MKNILVTGGAGFMGVNFINYILKQDDRIQVFNLDSLTYPNGYDNVKSAADPRHFFIKGDITDKVLLESIVTKNSIDTIVHFAAESHVDKSIENPFIFIHTNIMGTFFLCEVARKHNLRFHHISTDEVYGTLQEGEKAWTEESPYGPRSPYSASKASSDHIVRAYGNTFGLRYTITNSSNNYGPYQYYDKLIPLMILRCSQNLPLQIHGDGLQIRDWLHVEDHSAAIYTVLQKGVIGETYNVGGDNQWTVLDVVNEIRSFLNSGTITHVEDRTGQDRRYALNTSKIKALGWERKHNFTDGLKDTIRWYTK